MPWPRTPMLLLVAALAAGLASAAVVLWFALAQPWLGLRLAEGASGGVVVAQVAAQGPAARVPVGAQIRALGGAGLDPPLLLAAADMTEEPDTLPDAAAFARFLDRQGQLHAALRAGPVTLVLDSGPVTVTPAAARPLVDLPAVFWVQLGVGLLGPWLGGWVAALGRQDRAARFFLLAGLGLMLSAHAAALYSTRELALGMPLLDIASRVNGSGTLLFGVGMISLFLIYPVRLAGPRLLMLPTLLIGSWIAARLVGWPDGSYATQPAVLAAMLALCAAIAAQVRASRGDPTARAMLTWFGLSVVLGAGGFVLTIIVPTLLGLEPGLSQGYAFLFFLAIYAGLALAVSRYRLFDLANWSFHILFHVGGVALLLVVDAALIAFLALDRVPALGLSLAGVSLLYLPLRDHVARWLRAEHALPPEQLFAAITEVALAPGPAVAEDAYRRLLQALFDPAHIVPAPPPAASAPALAEDGEALDLPASGDLPALRMIWAQKGRRLFRGQDLRQAASMLDLLGKSLDLHRRYQAGVDEERQRINRDMHDNIGVQLLGALHSRTPERKDSLIRQTLTDLREIISNGGQAATTLPRLAGDLRAEIAEHLEAAGLSLQWRDDGLPDQPLPPRLAHTLRALLREGASNILRHSGASLVQVELALQGADLQVTISDNGRGHDAATDPPGNGLGNLRERIQHCDGTFRIDAGPSGTRLCASLPLLAAAGAGQGTSFLQGRAWP